MIYLASPYLDPDPLVRRERFRAACQAAAKLIRERINYPPNKTLTVLAGSIVLSRDQHFVGSFIRVRNEKLDSAGLHRSFLSE